ncbi:MAG: ATP-binding protein [Tannerellaceae bacterium]|jgi:AAA+ ATPase superfamily predicted ATPase|nr:ATP-binding protein [Tannerellaceae bacterium]
MEFYNREKEIKELLNTQKRSLENAQMTVITGRRRIGKTQLLLKATEGQPTLYFFVARKAESFLCQDFTQEIKDKLGIPILGEVNSFWELFKFLMELSKTQSFNLIMDEFQEFFNIAPSVYSDIQHYWDVNKDQSKMNLLLSGSVHSLMHKIFQNAKEPLFGRATALLRVKPFETSVLKEILADHSPDYTSEDLLALYTFTGGVAKYVQLLMDSGSYTLKAMLNYIIREDSTFIPEGKNMLIEEFGKEYANYFTILSAIARGENTRAKIEAVVNREIGGYLTKLEHDYGLISKVTPIFSKVETKNVRYTLEDNFLSFWFRFIYKYSYMVEVGGYEQLKEIIVRDYPTFSGKILERYFRAQYIEQMRFTRIGGYWDRKGENEIDMVAVNELGKIADIIEIKRNAGNINLDKLREKGIHFMKATGELSDYKVTYKALSMNDM